MKFNTLKEGLNVHKKITYNRNLKKRIELINWELENKKNPDVQICALLETRMNKIIDEINKKDSILEADPVDSELRILDWILCIVCSNDMDLSRLYPLGYLNPTNYKKLKNRLS